MMVEGDFESCREAVATLIRGVLEERVSPVFYLGAAADLLWRWRDIRDHVGKPCGHAHNRVERWHSEIALYKTSSGADCVAMEEHVLEQFSRDAYPHGRTMNKSFHSLGIRRSLTTKLTHWVYMCVPRG